MPRARGPSGASPHAPQQSPPAHRPPPQGAAARLGVATLPKARGWETGARARDPAERLRGPRKGQVISCQKMGTERDLPPQPLALPGPTHPRWCPASFEQSPPMLPRHRDDGKKVRKFAGSPGKKCSTAGGQEAEVLPGCRAGGLGAMQEVWELPVLPWLGDVPSLLHEDVSRSWRMTPIFPTVPP